MEYIKSKDTFKLDIDNYYIHDCILNNKTTTFTSTYLDTLKYLMNYICENKGMNELVNQSNYPSLFECEKYNDNVVCEHFLFDFNKLNNRQILNEIYELQTINQYNLSFALISDNELYNDRKFYIIGC